MFLRIASCIAVTAIIAGCSSDESNQPSTQDPTSLQPVAAQLTPSIAVTAFTTREANGVATFHLAQPGAARTRGAVQGEFLVKFKRSATWSATLHAHSQVSLQSVNAYRSVPRLHRVKLAVGAHAEEAVAAYRNNPEVEYIEPNYLVSVNAIPNDPRFAEQWALHNIGQTGGAVDADVDAPEAWDISTGSGGVVVAVIDSGVDYTHADLAANMFRNSADCNNNGIDDDGNGFIDDCNGIDTFNHDSNPMDDHGHGTHVAGTIGAVGNNGVGIAGVAWNVKVLPCKFIGAGGFGSTADAITCLDYVAAMKDRGVNVVATNNSWGGGSFSQALSDAIAVQRQKGILFIAAAGNNAGINDIDPHYPCSYDLPNVICVASTAERDFISDFSNVGNFSVHVGAPGSNILSTLPGNAYGLASGTSMATPHVSGVAALLAAQDPARNWVTIRNLLLSSGDTSAVAPLIRTVTKKRLNANAALNCHDSVVNARLRPASFFKEMHAVGQPLLLSALHLNCDRPNGNVLVSVAPSGETVTLFDDGLNGDVEAGDGVYSANWVPAASGTYTLTFQNSSNPVLTVVVDQHLKAGFPLKTLRLAGTFSSAYLHTLVGDFVGDERLEIMATGLAIGPMYVWHHDGTPAAGWPRAQGTEFLGAGYPVLAHLDSASSKLDLFVEYYGGWLAAYRSNANYLPGWPRSGFGIGLPATAADMANNDLDEIFHLEDVLRVYQGNGATLPGWPLRASGPPAVGDIDGDGVPEVVTLGGVNGATVVFIDRRDGSAVPGFPASFGEAFGGLPKIGDVDGDGNNDIVIVTRVGVAKVSNTGVIQKIVPAPVGGFERIEAALADLDADGIPEIVAQAEIRDAGASSVYLYAWRGNGQLLPGWPVLLGGFRMLGASAPVVGDVDGDGFPDIVVTTTQSGTSNGFLHALDRNGNTLAGFPKSLDIGFSSVPAIADIDLDGRNDIVLAGSGWTGMEGMFDNVWAFDLRAPTPYGPIEWGQFMEGPRHQSYYETGKNLPNHAYLTAHVRGSGTIASETAGIRCGTDCIELYPKGATVRLTATATNGDTFIGWLGACAGQPNPCTVRVSSYTSVAAQFSGRFQLSVALAGTGTGTVTSTPAGVNCGVDCSELYDGGTVVTLTASPAASSIFSGWSGACSGSASTCNVTVNAAKSVGATFTLKAVLNVAIAGTGTGTVASNPAGINCGADCSESYTPNTVVALTATPSANSVFSGWSGACSGAANPCSVTMDGAKSVTASFVPAPPPLPLTVSISGSGSGVVNSSPAGIICGTDCSEFYNPNTVVALTATPSANSVFSGWSGACSGASTSCGITMDAAKAVTAVFGLKPVLTVAKAGSGTGTVTSSPAGINCGADCTELYSPTALVTLTATPSAGSVFAGWSGSCSGSANTCNVAMTLPGNTVTATFNSASGGSSSSSGGGGGGGGCTLKPDNRFDPFLPFLATLATVVLWRRRRWV